MAGIEFTLPRQNRQLKAETKTIEDNNRAESGVVSNPSAYYFRRKVASKTVDGLKPLKLFQQEWKNALVALARYPFIQPGIRLLPAGLVQQFMDVNRDFESRRIQVFENWARNVYAEWLETAPTRMGALFQPVDFPTLSECRERFRCEVSVIPLASSQQWEQISLISPDLAATMAQQQDEAVQRSVRDTHKRIWQDVMGPLENVVTQLSKDKTKIHGTLISNVIDVVNLVPAYNQIHQDGNLQRMAERIKAELEAVDIEEVKKDAEAKQMLLDKTKAIVEEFEPFARVFDLDDDAPDEQQPDEPQ